MFRITRTQSDDGQHVYRVAHYVNDDQQPTPTQRDHVSRPAAWHDALGRAAKHSLLSGKPQTVVVDDGREIIVTARPKGASNG